METYNIHEAKTRLSELIRKAVMGEPFIIAKAGKPMVRVTAIEPPEEPGRLGFLAGKIRVPDDFDEMGAAEINRMFGGDA